MEIMQAVIIQSKSKSNLKLLMELAKKLGMTSRSLTEEEKEDIGFLKAMEEGKNSGRASEKSVFDALMR